MMDVSNSQTTDDGSSNIQILNTGWLSFIEILQVTKKIVTEIASSQSIVCINIHKYST